MKAQKGTISAAIQLNYTRRNLGRLIPLDALTRVRYGGDNLCYIAPNYPYFKSNGCRGLILTLIPLGLRPI